jgi:hypothetical protein
MSRVTARLVRVAAWCLAAGWIACGSDDSSVDNGRAPRDAGHFDSVDEAPVDVSAPIDALAPIDSSVPPIDASGSDGDASYVDSCMRSSECYVFPSDCCASSCATDLVPMSGVGRAGYFRSCNERGCQSCVVEPRWIPRCIDRRCSIVDLETSSDSACSVDSDCELRWGNRCCHPCGSVSETQLVSAARTAVFCAPDDYCDPCRQQDFPMGATAVCRDGRCQIQR